MSWHHGDGDSTWPEDRLGEARNLNRDGALVRAWQKDETLESEPQGTQPQTTAIVFREPPCCRLATVLGESCAQVSKKIGHKWGCNA